MDLDNCTLCVALVIRPLIHHTLNGLSLYIFTFSQIGSTGNRVH